MGFNPVVNLGWQLAGTAIPQVPSPESRTPCSDLPDSENCFEVRTRTAVIADGVLVPAQWKPRDILVAQIKKAGKKKSEDTRPIVAVRGFLGNTELETKLNALLKGYVSESSRFRTMDEENRQAILEEQAKSLSDAYSEASRMEVGTFVSPNKILTAQVVQFGETYAMSVDYSDIETGVTEKSVALRCKCTSDDFPETLEGLVLKLIGKLYPDAQVAASAVVEQSPSQVGLGTTYIDKAKESMKAFRRGNEYLRQKKFSEAEAAYKKAIGLDPNFAEDHHNLGLLYYEQRRYPEAEAAYKRAIEMGLNYTSTHNNLGAIYETQKRYPEAEASYKRAIELDPKFALAHSNLGALCSKQKRYPEAEVAFKRAIELDPKFAAAHSNLGSLCAEQKRYPEAEVAYKRAIELDPKFALAHSNLGLLYFEQSRYSEAETSYKQAIKLDPQNAHFYNSLANLYKKQGDRLKIIRAYETVLRLSKPGEPLHENAQKNLRELRGKAK